MTSTISCARRLMPLTVAALVWLVACGEPKGDTAPVVNIDAPAEVEAGTPIEVTVTTTAGGPVVLDVADALAITTLVEHADVDTATFVVDGALTQLSGVLTFHGVGPEGRHVSAATTIIPASGVESLDVTVGPRTVIADGDDQTMAVAIASDRYGNPHVDGTRVVFTSDDGGSMDRHATTVDHGVASVGIESDTTAGRVEVFAASPAEASATSGRVVYDEVAGVPAAVELSVPEPTESVLRADGRSLIELHTTEIVDIHGNPVPDGHVVHAHVVGPDGSGRLTSSTIEGVARFVLEAPEHPGDVELRARSGDARGEPLVLTFASAVSAVPVDLDADGDGLIVEIGPVTDHDGAIVSDGTRARVNGLFGAAGSDEEAVVELIGGRAVVIAPIAATPDLEVEVSVLGTTTKGTL